MRCVKRILAGLLITSAALGGLLPASIRAGVSGNALSGAQQSGGAVGEREQGRSVLHRGKAAVELVHLERAL